MSKDLTQKLDGSLEDKVDRLITIVESMDSWGRSIDSRMENVETRLGSLETRLGSLETRLGSVDTRLASLETKVDERLKDTRPMWEVVQTQLAELRESQDRLRGEMEKGFRIVDRRLESQPLEYDKLYRYHRDLEERVEKIEKQLS
jgi:chromosome segregation ATPase